MSEDLNQIYCGRSVDMNVKRLSYLLTHSFYAKLLAVRKVIQNKGKRTAGIDGKLWKTPEAKLKAALKLSDKRYKAKPLKRVYIKKEGKSKKFIIQ
jgi:RNA-directed DNA polymerase